MVAAARGYLANLSEKFADAIGGERTVTVGNTSLTSLRYESAARATLGAIRLRDLVMMDWSGAFAAQANTNRADALKALED